MQQQVHGWGVELLGLFHHDCYYQVWFDNYGWVAVQYHWILDESVPYLGGSEGRAKYKQDESNVQ